MCTLFLYLPYWFLSLYKQLFDVLTPLAAGLYGPELLGIKWLTQINLQNGC